ncbi:MAG: hypothetical protein ABIM88_02920 [candidate division WOR-3 bacterium]
MGHAYTPGLKVTKATVIRKERRLPVPGTVLVKLGDRVKADQTVAKADLPGNVVPLNVAGKLGIQPNEVPEAMRVKEGEAVKKGDLVAVSKGIMGLMKTSLKAPCDGTIESISAITGQVILREPPLPIEVKAYIDGKVVEVIEREGVLIETTASFVQGIFGIGGEVIGEIKVVVDSPDQELLPSLITEDAKGKVIVGGSFISVEAMRKARELGAVAVVAGGTDDRNLKDFLGYDIGVAITGQEDVGLTVILTEGFGRLRMAHKTFELLKSLEGKIASANGATQIRAGVIRPEIIVPTQEESLISEETVDEGVLEIGSLVRVIREPYFGLIGEVTKLPPEPTVIETEAKVRILELRLEDGRCVTVPRANVELIETL